MSLSMFEVMPSARLISQLKFEEGLRLKKYMCPAGFPTVGWGHNLLAGPDLYGVTIPDSITREFAELLLIIDAGKTIQELREKWPRLSELDPARRDACLNMSFQLGVAGFLKFERLKAALLAKDWESASDEALASRWALQTPERAGRVAEQIRTGKYYAEVY